MSFFKRSAKDSQSPELDPFGFLPAQGDLAQLVRRTDWSKTPLGAVGEWPQPLKTAVALCLDSTFATYVWWGEPLTTLYNDAAIAHLRERHPQALGMPARQIWPDTWANVESLVEKVLVGQPLAARNFEVVSARDENPDAAYFTFSYAPLRDEDGDVAGIFVTSMDTTAAVLAEHRLRASEQRFRAIVESATEYAIVTFNADGRITSWNPGAERLLGYTEEEAVGQPGDIFFTPEDRAAERPAIEMIRAREEGRASDERWHVRKDGSPFWGSGVMLPVEGHPRDRYLKIFRDHTEDRRARQRQNLLAEELNHRVKNILALVQSVAMQTLRQSASTAEARDALESRLVSLARAHDILTRTRWNGSGLNETLENTLRPMLHDEALAARVRMDGPYIHLGADAVVGLSLAVHELATNAVKYGALSNDQGHIEIAWEIVEGTPQCFRLKWTERGGPAVEAPARRGFGSRVIEEGLAHEFDGRVELKFAREGLECTIQAPLQEITGER